MEKLSRPRSAVEHAARRNYLIFCVVSIVLLMALVGGVSLYVHAP